MDLTIGVPSIRPQNLKKLYDSVDFKGSWQMVIVSPYPLPEELKDCENIIHIEDMGSPIRAQQLTLMHTSGDYYTWAADDSVFAPGALEKAYRWLEQNSDPKTVIMAKYIESEDTSGHDFMRSDDYYRLHTHRDCRMPFIPEHYLLLNAGMLHTEFLLAIGGWDCNFEVGGMCFVDLAIRLQNYGARFVNLNEVMLVCGHMPGRTGDHGPICDAQEQHDQPLFESIYTKPEALKRTIVPLNGWMDAPKRWERRFGKEENANVESVDMVQEPKKNLDSDAGKEQAN